MKDIRLKMETLMSVESDDRLGETTKKNFVTVKFSSTQMILLFKIASESGVNSVSVVADVFEAYAEKWCKLKARQ